MLKAYRHGRRKNDGTATQPRSRCATGPFIYSQRLRPCRIAIEVALKPLYSLVHGGAPCVEELSFLVQGGAPCVEELSPCVQEFLGSVEERHQTVVVDAPVADRGKGRPTCLQVMNRTAEFPSCGT